MFDKLKSFFSPKTIEVIIFDGKKMSYQHLTQKQLDALKKKPECKDWVITIKDEISS